MRDKDIIMWLQEHLTSFREVEVDYYEMWWRNHDGRPRITFGHGLTDCVLEAMSEEENDV